MTVLASAYTFLSPVASAMIAPATPNIAAEFDIRSPVEIVLTVSIFVLAYGTEHITFAALAFSVLMLLRYSAFGPLLFAPLSEIYGRVRLLQSTNILFLGAWNKPICSKRTETQSNSAFNLGCGFVQNKAQLSVLRFMAGLGGGAPLAVSTSLPNHRLMIHWVPRLVEV